MKPDQRFGENMRVLPQHPRPEVPRHQLTPASEEFLPVGFSEL